MPDDNITQLNLIEAKIIASSIVKKTTVSIVFFSANKKLIYQAI